MKIERLLEMIILLLDRKIVSASYLAERFEVTKRTIYRDIQTLEYAGFPIISYPGKYGGYGLIDTYKLHTHTFDDYEKEKLLVALQLQKEILPFQNTTKVVEEKIRTLQLHPNERLPISMTSATLHNPLVEQEIHIKLEKIHLAIQKQQKLEITYVANNGNFSTRIINPQELALHNGSWYLQAFCEKRQDYRQFKLTRIRELKITTLPTIIIPIKKIVDEEEMISIQLQFTKASLGKLYDFFIENQIEILENKVIVNVMVPMKTALVPFLLMFGDQVQVIWPMSLKQQHQEAIHKMRNIY